MTIQPAQFTETFPPFAIVVKGDYHNHTDVTCHVFVARNGQPFISHNQKYLAAQGGN